MAGSGRYFQVRTACAVEETVASLDGVVDGVGSVVLDLPETKAHEGHLIAAVELDGRGSHGCECASSCV